MPTPAPDPSGGAHVTHGLRRILEMPIIYRAFQASLSRPSGWPRVIKHYLRPLPGARYLDIGCGPGRLLDHLPKDVSYVGYDINPKYIEQAKELYGSRGTFFCRAVGTGEDERLTTGDFDYVLALALLHHLSDAEVKQLLAVVLRALKPGGVFFTLDCVYVPNQSRIAKFLISRDRGTAVRTADGYTALLRSHFVEMETYATHDLLRVPYTHFMMRAVKAGN